MTQLRADVRPMTPDDLAALAEIVTETGLFPPEMLADMAAPGLDGAPGELWLTCLADGTVQGFCYCASEAFADGVSNMRALAVAPDGQGKGLGAATVAAAEAALRARGDRLLLVDTSGTKDFAATRAFYAATGYVLTARIPDYWAEGDDKVTFAKRLLPD